MKTSAVTNGESAELQLSPPRLDTWEAYARYLLNMATLLQCLPPVERAELDRWEESSDFTSTDDWAGWDKYRDFLGPRPVVRRLRVVRRRK